MSYGKRSYGIVANELYPDKNPYGMDYSAANASVKTRYIRKWLKSLPIDASIDDTSLLSALIEAIEESDYDIGGPVP